MSVLQTQYKAVRSLTTSLGAHLSIEDQTGQSSTQTNSMKWHQALPTWFFETLVLRPYLLDYKAYQQELQQFFNSYYHSLNGRAPLTSLQRSFSRPSLHEIFEFRAHVDEAMERLLSSDIDSDTSCRILRGLNLEQRHQELALADIKHLFFSSPLRPAYQRQLFPVEPRQSASNLEWLSVEGGLAQIGRSYLLDEPLTFCLSNEGPRHRVFLEPFQLASRKASCREYLEFISDQGYARKELWLSEGWTASQKKHWAAPLYWEQDAEDPAGWRVFTLGGCYPISELLDTPVCHVSFFEADAFARWRRSRLPTESEWEFVASQEHQQGNLLETGKLHPSTATGTGLQQIFGDCWEWTSSPYTSYPSYRVVPAELDNLDEPFTPSQMVSRGGSCITARALATATYRNSLSPATRKHFTGVRLAY
jgi:ergothioneine biosynthesis protein EgtB